VQAGAKTGSLSRAAYFRWLGRGITSLFRPAGWQWMRATYVYYCTAYPAPMLKWVFRRAVDEYPLFGVERARIRPVSAPAACWNPPYSPCRQRRHLRHQPRRGCHRPSQGVQLHHRGLYRGRAAQGLSSRPLFPAAAAVRPLLGFCDLGLTLISTALFSMLPYFTFRTQVGLVETHRWGALAAALSAMAFFDALLPRKAA